MLIQAQVELPPSPSNHLSTKNQKHTHTHSFYLSCFHQHLIPTTHNYFSFSSRFLVIDSILELGILFLHLGRL
ncbi:hypothetical protein L1887_31862 [Cichorium endivia]|nr:hypothetical protein L1887_31862 [Cichorium endivia]